jgi:hypothetical protein
VLVFSVPCTSCKSDRTNVLVMSLTIGFEPLQGLHQLASFTTRPSGTRWKAAKLGTMTSSSSLIWMPSFFQASKQPSSASQSTTISIKDMRTHTHTHTHKHTCPLESLLQTFALQVIHFCHDGYSRSWLVSSGGVSFGIVFTSFYLCGALITGPT